MTSESKSKVKGTLSMTYINWSIVNTLNVMPFIPSQRLGLILIWFLDNHAFSKPKCVSNFILFSLAYMQDQLRWFTYNFLHAWLFFSKFDSHVCNTVEYWGILRNENGNQSTTPQFLNKIISNEQLSELPVFYL